MPKIKRATSDKEKQQREQMIIDAAQQLLMEKSYHSINMNEIARTANLAKGTVYLYFQTKEELFLTLFERQFGVWLDTVEADLRALDANARKSDVVGILVHRTAENRQLIRLSALTNIIFEHNISYDKAREYKYWLAERVNHLGQVLDQVLGLASPQGFHVLYRLYVFVIGLEHIANPAPVAQELYANEPELAHPDFEQELRALVTMVVENL